MMRTLAVSFTMKRVVPTKLSVTIFTFAESVSFTKSYCGDQVNSSSQDFTSVKFFMGVLAKKVMCSMGKLPVSHCTLKLTMSPSSIYNVELTDGFTLEGMISVL